jgi:hypothetical protein
MSLLIGFRALIERRVDAHEERDERKGTSRFTVPAKCSTLFGK